MKDNIHPQYFANAPVTCVCGASWTTGSSQKDLRVDICSNCHPYYTGKQQRVDTEGRVDRFRRKYATPATAATAGTAAATAKK